MSKDMGVAATPPLSHPFGAEPVPVSGKAGIANAVDITSAMISANIGKIERYPQGWFTVALVDGSWGQGRSVGEAFANIGKRRQAA